jgi:hypothetical protein
MFDHLSLQYITDFLILSALHQQFQIELHHLSYVPQQAKLTFLVLMSRLLLPQQRTRTNTTNNNFKTLLTIYTGMSIYISMGT